MGLSEYLALDGIVPNLHARCKREALAILARRAAEITGVDAETIEEALMTREHLGSTGVGHGVAIPHGKIGDLTEITALFAQLDAPLEFDAIDDAPVDIVFMLLAPEEATAAHLKALAKASRLLRDESVRNSLRGADTKEAIYAILTETATSNAA
ncbi:MAG: transcriptional regulator [Alphaproteobacteria bacterium]|nr:transcriptional regulator [Alphaproteobacteria bacterium]